MGVKELPRVSVIIPVYNTEKYLDRCLRSIVDQIYTCIEIVLVNDGSTDTSGQICENWVREDDRIKLITQQNTGAGGARNNGLANCSGKYVCFVDSDDTIEPNTISDAVERIEKDNSDLVLYGLRRKSFDGEDIEEYCPHYETLLFEGDECRNTVLRDMLFAEETQNNRPSLSCCTCLYNVEFLKQIGWKFRDVNEVYSEDIFATLELYRHVKKVSMLESNYYNYYMHEGSTSHSYNPNRCLSLSNLYVSTIRMYEDNRHVIKNFCLCYCGLTIAELKAIVTKSGFGFGEQIRGIKELLSDPSIAGALSNIEAGRFRFRKKNNVLCDAVQTLLYLLDLDPLT